MGRLTLWDNGKLGLRCIDRGKKARSGTTERSPTGRLTLWDNGKLGLRCTDLGTDGVVRGTLDKLPTDGLWNNKSVCLICV